MILTEIGKQLLAGGVPPTGSALLEELRQTGDRLGPRATFVPLALGSRFSFHDACLLCHHPLRGKTMLFHVLMCFHSANTP